VLAILHEIGIIPLYRRNAMNSEELI